MSTRGDHGDEKLFSLIVPLLLDLLIFPVFLGLLFLDPTLDRFRMLSAPCISISISTIREGSARLTDFIQGGHSFNLGSKLFFTHICPFLLLEGFAKGWHVKAGIHYTKGDRSYDRQPCRMQRIDSQMSGYHSSYSWRRSLTVSSNASSSV